MKTTELVKKIKFKQAPDEPLPPWVQFPEYPPFHIGWRMGPGQGYLEQVFWPFWRGLGFDDKCAYFDKYDLGPQWEDRDTWYSELTCGEFAFDEYIVNTRDQEALEQRIETALEKSKSIKHFKKTDPLWWEADYDSEVYVTCTDEEWILHVDALLSHQAEEFKEIILQHKKITLLKREDGC